MKKQTNNTSKNKAKASQAGDIINTVITDNYFFDNTFFMAQAIVKRRRQKKSTKSFFDAIIHAGKYVSVRDLDPMIRAWMGVCKFDGFALYDFANKINFYPEYGAEIIIGLAKLHIREKDKGYRKLIHRLIINACCEWFDDEIQLGEAA